MENWDRIPKEVWYDKIHFNLKIWTSIYKNSVLIKKKKNIQAHVGKWKDGMFHPREPGWKNQNWWFGKK